uniref:(California timema) hypothetical protein n=1 Tax=Timema californicum TaxID=61474 RepID=A0A7R9PFA4_TIMCA|nr:unnamed protein product [Timema californicum]
MKQLKVRLNGQMRAESEEREGEAVTLKDQDGERQNVLKRKAEGAEAINKRLKVTFISLHFEF